METNPIATSVDYAALIKQQQEAQAAALAFQSATATSQIAFQAASASQKTQTDLQAQAIRDSKPN